MNIDWSKAPEGTEAGSPESHEFFACWYRRNAFGEVEAIIVGTNDYWVHMGGRRDFPYGAVLRPKP